MTSATRRMLVMATLTGAVLGLSVAATPAAASPAVGASHIAPANQSDTRLAALDAVPLNKPASSIGGGEEKGSGGAPKPSGRNDRPNSNRSN
jgi:hypothetical protein